MGHQIQVWIISGQPLLESEWLAAGYEDLKEYLDHEIQKTPYYKKKQHLPYAQFGFFNARSGEKSVVLSCETPEDLPTETVVDENNKPLIVFDGE